jgi:glycosyltransferase involved in cell wall biosynthesis
MYLLSISRLVPGEKKTVHNLKAGESPPLLSIVVVDSRSDVHPEWVEQCYQSLQAQTVPVDVIFIDNVGRTKTIGECFNAGVSLAKCDWVAFVGDDDFVAPEYAEFLERWIYSNRVQESKIVNVATYMTTWNEATPEYKKFLTRQSTGAWKKEYLLKYPFNEKLEKGIDREYIEEMVKRGDQSLIIEYFFGYFYRRHDDYHCAGKITFHKEAPDHYFITSNRIFLTPITERIAKRGKVFVEPHFTPQFAEGAKTIWVEWANQKAIDVANFDTGAKKILRLHAYEAFSDLIKKRDLNLRKFDTVIFIDDYIKEYVENNFYDGHLENAIVIPNGVDLDKYRLRTTYNGNELRNNKIAYAGYLTRKKGIGELLFIAKSLPEYEFHLAGRYQEDDIADWMNKKKPDNIFIYEWKYENAMNQFYQDKTYILNTSLRESQGMTMMEGMACGLKPLVADWIGAKEIYGHNVYRNLDELKFLLEDSYEPEKYRDFIKEKYDMELIYPQIEQLFSEVLV